VPAAAASPLLLPFKVCFSSFFSLWEAAMAAVASWMRKRAEVSRVALGRFPPPLEVEEKEESVYLAPSRDASLRKRKDEGAMRLPSVCVCATEPLIPLLLHLLADLELFLCLVLPILVPPQVDTHWWSTLPQLSW
jgi:hypothetical protein